MKYRIEDEERQIKKRIEHIRKERLKFEEQKETNKYNNSVQNELNQNLNSLIDKKK